MSSVDPVTLLTPQEKALVEALSKKPREEILSELKENLQTAIWIELATIPIYLYTYYSIQRAEKSGENLRPADLFANKAGGVIMSVAVEEMLHMSLSSNVYFALTGKPPQLYLKSPGPYPTSLPYHNPVGPPGPDGSDKVEIPLAKLSYEQLWHFLQIEYPESTGTLPEDRNWDTIGQFYSYIRCLISCPQVKDEDFRQGPADYQIQSYNYSPNNIDTAHPKAKFDPWGIPPAQNGAKQSAEGGCPSAAAATEFSDAPDSHAGPTQLVTVSNKEEALIAIDTVCFQGEGFNHEAYDDPSHAEASHYYKFLSLQAQFEDYTKPDHQEMLPTKPKPPEPITPTADPFLEEVVLSFPDNPTTAQYLEIQQSLGGVNYKPLSDLVNGVYQYMLILTETIFKVRDTGPEGGGQKLFFNLAMHRSMIWVLDKLAQTMRKYKLEDGTVLAPTFENIDLGSRAEAFTNLNKLGDACKGMPYYPDINYYLGVIETLPEVSKYWSSPGLSEAGQPKPLVVGPRNDPSTEAGPGEPTPKPYPYESAPLWPKKIGPQPPGMPLHACMGLNSCKGSDRFGTEGPPGGSPNDCAGQGYCATTPDHTCHVQNECKNQGGCGLYGTAEELDQPALNECKSLGSCATPINAERFSTNGPNQGKSVWVRAREVFEKNWNDGKNLSKRVPSRYDPPNRLGPVPAPFADTGPPYLWISDDNEDRDNMTACGASGLSGAGGCS